MDEEKIIERILDDNMIVFRKEEQIIRVFVCKDYKYPEDRYIVMQFIHEGNTMPYYIDSALYSYGLLK